MSKITDKNRELILKEHRCLILKINQKLSEGKKNFSLLNDFSKSRILLCNLEKIVQNSNDVLFETFVKGDKPKSVQNIEFIYGSDFTIGFQLSNKLKFLLTTRNELQVVFSETNLEEDYSTHSYDKLSQNFSFEQFTQIGEVLNLIEKHVNTKIEKIHQKLQNQNEEKKKISIEDKISQEILNIKF